MVDVPVRRTAVSDPLRLARLCHDAVAMADYDAWLVDLDGTLYRALPVKAAMALELGVAGPRVIRILRVFRKQHEIIRRELPSNADAHRLQLERAAEAVRGDVATVERVVVEWMHDRPGRWLSAFRRRGLLDEIRAFRASGGKTAVVSDYPAARKLASLGVASLFDVVVASGEPGGPPWLKPHPGGYLLAAERLGIPPRRCLVIGDRDDADGEAARAAGMGFRLI